MEELGFEKIDLNTKSDSAQVPSEKSSVSMKRKFGFGSKSKASVLAIILLIFVGVFLSFIAVKAAALYKDSQKNQRTGYNNYFSHSQ